MVVVLSNNGCFRKKRIPCNIHCRCTVLHISFGIKGWCKKYGIFPGTWIESDEFHYMPQILGNPPEILHGFPGLPAVEADPGSFPKRIPFQSTIFCKCQTVSCYGRNLLDDLDHVFFHEDHLVPRFVEAETKEFPPKHTKMELPRHLTVEPVSSQVMEWHVQSDLWEDCWLPENWSWNIWVEPRPRMNLIELFE